MGHRRSIFVKAQHIMIAIDLEHRRLVSPLIATWYLDVLKNKLGTPTKSDASLAPENTTNRLALTASKCCPSKTATGISNRVMKCTWTSALLAYYRLLHPLASDCAKAEYISSRCSVAYGISERASSATSRSSASEVLLS